MAESVLDDLEPLLGRGVRLPQPLGPVRLFPLLPKVPGSGTVLILHGEQQDWLGNQSKDGATPGGATALGLALRGLGFTAVLLDSFFDDRRDRLEKPTQAIDRRVSDILAALAYVQSRNFPPPYHLYGQSQGASTVLRLFAASARRDVRAREARWALSCLSSCICEGEATMDEQELSPLQLASEQGRVPPLLLLAAEAAAPAVQRAASAMGGRSVQEYEKLQLDGRRHVDCLVECRVVDGSVRCVARTYDAVKDRRGQKLQDDSGEDVANHMSTMACAWLQRFNPEIWQEAGEDEGDELAQCMPVAPL